jgi:hypothetical protein
MLEETKGREVTLWINKKIKMLFHDGKSTVQQLNMCCGRENVFFYICVTKRIIHVEVA